MCNFVGFANSYTLVLCYNYGMKKNAIITGASGEIGRAIALEICDKYNLTLVGGQNTKALASVCDEVSALGTKCQCLSGDVGNSSFATEVVSIAKKYGTIDAFIHCAGKSYVGLTQDMSSEDWSSTINTNLSSCFYFSKALIPDMLISKGKMLFISSIWGNCGASCEVAYSASKAGLEGFVKALSKELAPSGIAVNAIAPGFIDTKMNSHLSEDDVAEFTEQIPFGRIGTATEVAGAVDKILLCPPYMTGQIIRVDGGLI